MEEAIRNASPKRGPIRDIVDGLFDHESGVNPGKVARGFAELLERFVAPAARGGVETRSGVGFNNPPIPRSSSAPREISPEYRAHLLARKALGFSLTGPLTVDDVKDRRRTLARQYHPDQAPEGPERDARTKKMAEINAAADKLLADLEAKVAQPL